MNAVRPPAAHAGRDPAELADLVAEVTTAVPGVSGLHGGRFGEIGTYLANRRVTGVRIDDDHCELHIAVEAGHPLVGTADAVRAAVRPLLDGPIDVTIEDIVVSGDAQDQS